MERYVHHRHGVVEVIEQTPSLVKVLSDGCEFWLRRDELLSLQLATEPVGNFISWLNGEGYSLVARIPNEDEWQRCETEYLAWANEELPLDCVYLRPKDKHFNSNKQGHRLVPFVREWRLGFKLKPGIDVPFRLRPLGTAYLGGDFSITGPEHECGILYPNGWVDVYWITLIERLVRAGLRARRLKNEG